MMNEDPHGETTVIGRNRRLYELGLVGAIALGLLGVVGGTVLLLTGSVSDRFDPLWTFRTGSLVVAAGWTLIALSLVMSTPIRSLRTFGLESSGGESYERARHWTGLKSSSILLSLLGGLAGLVLFASLLTFLGILQPDRLIALPLVRDGHLPTLLSLFLAGVLTYAHVMSLRAGREELPAGPLAAIPYIGAVGTVILVAAGATLSRFDPLREVLGGLTPYHAPFFMLGGAAAATAVSFLSRDLPGVHRLFTERHEYYGGRASAKTVMVPTLIAFALLFGVVLAVFLFELHVVGLVQQIPTNTLLLTILGVIVLGIGVSIWASFSLARSDDPDQAELYKELRSNEATKQLTILVTSAVASTVFLVWAGLTFMEASLGAFTLSKIHWLDLVAFALLSALGPYGFYHHTKVKRTRALEARFPDFIRDLAASRKAGLTLESSVYIAARGEYGALSPDIQKMADQLSWNVPFEEALERFCERVRTPLIERAVSLIIEAGRSGGNVTDVLEAAAADVRELKHMQNERKLTMGLYTGIVYIAFFVFLGVAAVLYGTFIPEIITASQAAQGKAAVGGFSFTQISVGDFRTFYFTAAIVQACGNGFIAGMMEAGDVRGGMKHAFAMLAIAILVFVVALS